jgi:hypothetical protein
MAQDWNNRLDRNHKYQVWITSWPEDGSEEATAAASACNRTHATAVIVGQFDNVADAAACVNANESREPVMTKLVTWQTNITDVTDLASEHQTEARTSQETPLT